MSSSVPKVRVALAALTLSAGGLVAIVGEEGYTDQAVRPTPLDVPTVGFGSTVKEDGVPVRMGDTTTPPKALRMAVSHIQRDERILKACAPEVTLTQAEYDLYVDFAYNVGAQQFCGSTMLAKLKAGDRPGACAQFLRWRFHKGFDCSAPGNRICGGLWARRQRQHAACIAEV